MGAFNGSSENYVWSTVRRLKYGRVYIARKRFETSTSIPLHDFIGGGGAREWGEQGRQSYDFGAVIGPHSQWQKVYFFSQFTTLNFHKLYSPKSQDCLCVVWVTVCCIIWGAKYQKMLDMLECPH